MSEPSQKRNTASILSRGLLLAAIIVGGLVFFNRQHLIDQYSIWQYQPTHEEKVIQDSLQLTSEGERLYNASQVALEPAEQFNNSCHQQSETNNPILGCYAAQRIYVYQITNEKLRGIEETTAAHELLHAAYERMSNNDRAEVDRALVSAYERLKTPELVERMAYYEKTQPGQEANELHSILGSEYADLGETLERHYAKYFQSRTHILGFYESYSTVFRSATNTMKQLEDSISKETKAVNARVEAYNSAIKSLQTDSQAFVEKNRNGGFTSQQDFDQQQGALITRQSELISERNQINAKIQALNNDRRRYNALVEEYNDLNRSINSSLLKPAAEIE